MFSISVNGLFKEVFRIHLCLNGNFSLIAEANAYLAQVVCLLKWDSKACHVLLLKLKIYSAYVC